MWRYEGKNKQIEGHICGGARAAKTREGKQQRARATTKQIQGKQKRVEVQKKRVVGPRATKNVLRERKNVVLHIKKYVPKYRGGVDTPRPPRLK